MKQITITVPDNCELRKDGNVYTIIEKEKKLTYEGIAEELFLNKNIFYIDMYGYIQRKTVENKLAKNELIASYNATTTYQLKKLLAINKLMNVAKYLNGDWQPDWDDETEDKVYISYNYITNEINFNEHLIYQSSYIYFKSKELAKQAIEILGEETIKLTFCTNY